MNSNDKHLETYANNMIEEQIAKGELKLPHVRATAYDDEVREVPLTEIGLNQEKTLPMEVLEVDGVKPQPTKSQINSKLNTGSSGGDIISKIVVLKNIIKLAEERRDRAIERIKDDKRKLKKLEKMLDDFKKL